MTLLKRLLPRFQRARSRVRMILTSAFVSLSVVSLWMHRSRPYNDIYNTVSTLTAQMKPKSVKREKEMIPYPRWTGKKERNDRVSRYCMLLRQIVLFLFQSASSIKSTRSVSKEKGRRSSNSRPFRLVVRAGVLDIQSNPMPSQCTSSGPVQPLASPSRPIRLQIDRY